MQSFTCTRLPGRAVFGFGALDQLPREIDLLGAKRGLVLMTSEQAAQAEDLAKRLGDRRVAVFAWAVVHVPIEIAREDRAEAK